ncbi:MAG: hhoB [Alphaproteobacteria bacterium]|jgi:S1-C subfamily serine protease|nr:hhoB [Alphaproteobacteria bacterium]
MIRQAAPYLVFTFCLLMLAVGSVQAQDENAAPPAAAAEAAPDVDPALAAPEVEAVAAPVPAKPADITDEAQRIWEKHGEAIYQVQVIDLASDKKNSIGSGFQFTKDGMMATNYHVVAEAVQRSESNRLEYLDEKGRRGSLKVLVADVGHDLAIVQMDPPGPAFVELGKSDLPKGTRLFALGNPHDISFTIIEGTHNGVSRESFIDKIHFSGSLNPGMSGGPVLGHDGKVVGVNVSTAGNSISFLVPVEPLKQLASELAAQKPGYDFIANSAQYIENQLLETQEKVISKLLADKWESVPFGPFMVPGRINNAFKCWGDTMKDENDKQPYARFSRSTCQSMDRLFLDSEFDTGIFMYRYDYLTAHERLALPRFYSYYESQYGMPLGLGEAAEENVTNYDCSNSFIDMVGQRWKSSFCVRQYKKYPKLYDMQVYMALVGGAREGFMVTQIAEGVSKENALKLAQKFLQEISARPVEAGKSKPANAGKEPKDAPVSGKAPAQKSPDAKAPAQKEGAK